MTRNDGVEVELEDCVEDLDPFDGAGAVAVVETGMPSVIEVAGVNDPQVRKVDDGIAVGVPAPK